MFELRSKKILVFIIVILIIMAIITSFWIFSILHNEPPIADAGDNILVDTNQLINLNGEQSVDPDGFITNYSWEFSDGFIAYGINVSRSFADDGNYTVTLTVIDNEGAKGSDEIEIIVNNIPPVVRAEIDQFYRTYIRPPSLFKNYTTSYPHYVKTNYSSDSIIASYDKLYLIASNSIDTDGYISNYTWYFDDGKIGYGSSTIHYFTQGGTHTITLTIQDDDGLVSTGSIDINISNRPPFAYIGDDITINKNENVTLNASLPLPFFPQIKTYDPDGYIINYTWDFGDGKISYGEVVTHTYVKNGTFLVNLTVEDNDGDKNSDTALIIVSNVPPIADAGNYIIGNITKPVVFNGSGYDIDGEIVLYEWDFNNDGLFDWNSTIGNASYVFNSIGIYLITLRVIDNDGGFGVDTLKVYVGNGTSYPPIALAEISNRDPENYSLFYIYKIFCNGSESISLDNDNLTFYWDFGDGEGGEGIIINHTYPMDGKKEYEVTFSVSDEEFTDFVIYNIIIHTIIVDYFIMEIIYIFEKA